MKEHETSERLTATPAQAAHAPGPWMITEAELSDSWAHVSDNADGFGNIATTWNDKGRANARLIAAAPEFKEAAHDYGVIIKRAQDILTAFLTPDGNDAEAACSALLELLDGPQWRAAHAKYAAAIAKATGQQ